MEIDLNTDSLKIIHALDSETRLDIINHLAARTMTVTELANELHYSKAIISRHIHMLEDANIVHESQSTDQRQKKLSISSENILINLPEKIYPHFDRMDYDIEIGNYFANEGIEKTCGLANRDEIIGKMDDTSVFLSSERFSATLLWFSKGTVEYMIPNEMGTTRRPELIDISFEISSEFPESNNNWPSDITFWVNNIAVGTWTVPGNFSDVRGKLTPDWWPSGRSQYGLFRHLRIYKEHTGMDGEKLSDVSLDDLNITDNDTIRFKIGIDKNSPNQGGLTLFGRDFGNHAQDIHITYFYSSAS